MYKKNLRVSGRSTISLASDNMTATVCANQVVILGKLDALINKLGNEVIQKSKSECPSSFS